MPLRRYQEEGTRWLAARKRAYLADSMRLGKTIQALSAARIVGARRVLVIAPASAIPGWHEEWKTWGPTGLLGTVSYDTLIRRSDVVGSDWDLVVGDEAHYCKTPGAKRSKAFYKVASTAPRVWLLSGTPMPNNPGELWAPIKNLWPEIPRAYGVKTSWDWFTRYCNYVQTLNGPRATAVKQETAQELRDILNRIMLRRTLESVGVQMPELDVQVILLPKDQAFVDALREIGDERDLLRMMQDERSAPDPSVSRLRRYLGEYKAPLIAKILIDELKDYPHKLVVMAYHHSVLDRLQQAFDREDIEVVGFRGDASVGQRAAAIEAFQHGTARVFLAQQNAAGVGISLSAANEIVLVEPSWSPNDNAQPIHRIMHIGKDSPCRARYFAVDGTIDKDVLKVNAQKTRMMRVLP